MVTEITASHDHVLRSHDYHMRSHDHIWQDTFTRQVGSSHAQGTFNCILTKHRVYCLRPIGKSFSPSSRNNYNRGSKNTCITSTCGCVASLPSTFEFVGVNKFSTFLIRKLCLNFCLKKLQIFFGGGGMFRY